MRYRGALEECLHVSAPALPRAPGRGPRAAVSRGADRWWGGAGVVDVLGRGGGHAGHAFRSPGAARRAADAGPAARRKRRDRSGDGATSTTNWWAHATRATRAEA